MDMVKLRPQAHWPLANVVHLLFLMSLFEHLWEKETLSLQATATVICQLCCVKRLFLFWVLLLFCFVGHRVSLAVLELVL